MATQKHEEELEQFYRTYRIYVHAMCRKKLARLEDAEELESLVWMEVFKSFDKFNVHVPRVLLRQLINWRAKDMYRQMYRDAGYEYIEWSQDEKALLHLFERSRSSISREEQVALHQALALEHVEDRQILIARYVQGHTWEEISEQHNLHRNTLLKRSNAILNRLKRRLLETSKGKTRYE